MNPAQFLHTHRVFTRDEMAAALAVPRRRSDATLDSHLSLWGGAGRVRRLRKGLYVRTDPVSANGAADVDPYGVAARLAPDAVLGFHTALELHGLAQSVFQRLYVCTFSKVRSLDFAGVHYAPVRPRAGFAEAPLDGVEKRDRPDGPVRVTSLERTLLDVLDRPELGGGVEEVWRSLTAVRALEFRALERLFARVERPVLAARLGFVLERMSQRWLVPERLLSRLAGLRPRGPVYFDRRQRGSLVPRWNLVVPASLSGKSTGPTNDDRV